MGGDCEKNLRGQRALCSHRGRRGGCGHTFSIFLSSAVPSYSVGAILLARIFTGLLAGLSVKKAAESLHTLFALETFYKLRTRLRGRLDVLRIRLLQTTGPPECDSSDPLIQTLLHLKKAFQASVPGGDPVGMVAWYQIHFQRPFFG